MRPLPHSLVLGERPLSLEDVQDLVRGRCVLHGMSPEVRAKNERTRAALLQRLEQEGTVYGVTTGFGDSCQTSVTGELIAQLPRNLYRFHGCGVGEVFSPEETRAILVARLASLATGYSAVRPALIEALALFLKEDVLPLIPSLGSVGASGDLTPLSYIAASLSGEGQVLYRGEVQSAAQALQQLGLSPLQLEPKESLALMNGTSVMTGLAALCLPRAQRLARLAAALTAFCSEVLSGEPRHFDERIFQAKPHPGQALVARWIREDLQFSPQEHTRAARVQDRYSLRCAPQVLGVLVDLLPLFTQWVETELNSANDNPLIDPNSGDILHGGNFYGGHICSAMDTLKTQVANLADLLERQLVLLCHPHTNQGLPVNLSGVSPECAPAHHGFKAMQITASALTAEVNKLSMPASVFSRSTENHNQDKVSMGTIAARDCCRALDLAETVAAIHTLACVQARDLRLAQGPLPPPWTHPERSSQRLYEKVRSQIPPLQEDRAMASEIQQVLDWLRQDELA